MSGQLFGEEARRAWLAAGAPDYNNPTKDESGNVTGYHSVTETPPEQRSESNQDLRFTPTDWTRKTFPSTGGQSTVQNAWPDQQPAPQQPSGQQAAGAEPVAIDGQRFSQQPAEIQDLFRRVHGARAAEQWVIEHNMAVLRDQPNVQQGQTPTVVANPVSPGTTQPAQKPIAPGVGAGSDEFLTRVVDWAKQHPLTVGAGLVGWYILSRGGSRRRY